MIAGVDVGGEDGLVLAAKHRGHLGGQASDDRAVTVDLEPGPLDVIWSRGERTHSIILRFSGRPIIIDALPRAGQSVPLWYRPEKPLKVAHVSPLATQQR